MIDFQLNFGPIYLRNFNFENFSFTNTLKYFATNSIRQKTKIKSIRKTQLVDWNKEQNIWKTNKLYLVTGVRSGPAVSSPGRSARSGQARGCTAHAWRRGAGRRRCRPGSGTAAAGLGNPAESAVTGETAGSPDLSRSPTGSGMESSGESEHPL